MFISKQIWYGACDLTLPLRTMSLLNEAYRLRYTGESAGAAKKRKALAHLKETIERTEHAHQAKRAKAEAQFRENPHWFGPQRCPRSVQRGELVTWKHVREGFPPHPLGADIHWSVKQREQWLEERGLAPLSEEETPSMDTLVRYHLKETVADEAVVPLTTKLLTSILAACK